MRSSQGTWSDVFHISTSLFVELVVNSEKSHIQRPHHFYKWTPAWTLMDIFTYGQGTLAKISLLGGHFKKNISVANFIIDTFLKMASSGHFNQLPYQQAASPSLLSIPLSLCCLFCYLFSFSAALPRLHVVYLLILAPLWTSLSPSLFLSHPILLFLPYPV